ncbi:hypothetical protein [Lysobacter antibioticus]|uniref:hypothetical protein n=1 Tax=Lysobacter antibioticus TaxID=84531 RepID=UPI00126A65FE|nr:hypothetical protein [Lysobacter antibioticus]
MHRRIVRAARLSSRDRRRGKDRKRADEIVRRMRTTDAYDGCARRGARIADTVVAPPRALARTVSIGLDWPCQL